MTVIEAPASPSDAGGGTERFRLHRAGVLNVWQYDDQVFNFADGRLLLRGANGAGKSKTLEMLLPFALDGDKAKITASAKHHTSLLWLMTDGVDGGNRIGYVWVEFLRSIPGGARQTLTCGVGIRASVSARSATAWHFVTDQRVGEDFSLEDDAGPLNLPRLKEVLGAEHVFERSADYKEHVGRTLFGLSTPQYDEVLRLLYWLRQPQVGEDIEPVKLAQQLSQALPQLDEQAVRSAGDTFDELTAFGEQLERRSAAATALASLSDAYVDYARSVVAERARAVTDVLKSERRARSDLKAAESHLAQVSEQQVAADQLRSESIAAARADGSRLRALEDSPEFRNQRRLAELDQVAEHDARIAEDARRRLDSQTATVARLGARANKQAQDVGTGLTEHADRLRRLDVPYRKAVPQAGLRIPSMLGEARLEEGEQLDAITGALDQTSREITQAQSHARGRIAAVDLVRNALKAADDAADGQTRAEDSARRTEARWEQARDDRIVAEAEADRECDLLLAALVQWMDSAGAPKFEVPEVLTEELVGNLPSAAQAAANPTLGELHGAMAKKLARVAEADTEIQRLTAQREVVAAERSPAPLPPQLRRTDRTEGQSLWQVIDFAADLADSRRAGLEAALQSAGLLDAWIRPGGLLLDPEHHDVLLVGSPSRERTSGGLNQVLVPDLPQGCDLSIDDVRCVLAAIGTEDHRDVSAWVSTDGSWRLGPAHGHFEKERAQFIGATARHNERRRRLEQLDLELDEQRRIRDENAVAAASVEASIAVLEAWVVGVPSGQKLTSAWTRADERRGAELREEAENRTAQRDAQVARAAAAQARAALEVAAAEQRLPMEREGLDAIEQVLRTLAQDLRDEERRVPGIRDGLARWRDDLEELDEAARRLAADTESAETSEQQARLSRAEADEVRRSVGASGEELLRRIAILKSSIAAHERRSADAEGKANRLRQEVGVAEADIRNVRQRLSEFLAERASALSSFAAMFEVPGLLDATGVTQEQRSLTEGLAGHPADEPIPRAPVTAVQQLSELSKDVSVTSVTKVWNAHREAAAGPAADHQPTVAQFGELLAVTGRDDAGDSAIFALARRVGASIAHDRDLLTSREREQFEQHVLGELGDAIRNCRRDADELVTAMNDQLGHVTTSQGIRVRLSWKLRDDVPPEARVAVGLLTQPVGALIPEERAELRDVLHRLIESSRTERPELSYGEHLKAALDYRTWSAFTIRYSRPEKPGHWERLHRRSPLSQGEQKVLCYLPLFAAAAAHFTSLAGAAPYAPRFVLLDDAFPKIDVRTHPLLFGLLVQLDLDFVITSERLWGDHESVPSLAIYEALRDPGQRGMAQYEYRWDGRVLQGIG